MPHLHVDGVNFVFDDAWHVERYDTWVFYRNRFSTSLSAKAVDILAISPNGTVFLIEVKDYRVHQRAKAIGLAHEVTAKVFDTLAAILPAKVNGDDANEVAFSRRILNTTQLRVVLHLEQPAKHSKLFPRIFEPADIQMKMRQMLKPIDAHPLVVQRGQIMGLPWSVD